MFGLSPTEMLIVGVVAVLLFGSRLPSVARSAGRSLTEFKRGMQDLQDDMRRSMVADDDPPKRTPIDSESDDRQIDEQYTGVDPEPALSEPPQYESDDSPEGVNAARADATQTDAEQAVGESAETTPEASQQTPVTRGSVDQN